MNETWLSCTVDEPGDNYAAWYVGFSGGEAIVVRQDTNEIVAVDIGQPNVSVVLDLGPA